MDQHMTEMLEELRSLGLPDGEWAIFGSGPMAARNIKDNHHDLDIIARGEAWKRAAELGEVVQADMGDHVVRFFGDAIEIFDGWKPGEWDKDELIDSAEMIAGFPWVRLDHVIEWKKRMGRVKDIKDLELIDAFLKRKTET